jgi:hypothetical protein
VEVREGEDDIDVEEHAGGEAGLEEDVLQSGVMRPFLSGLGLRLLLLAILGYYSYSRRSSSSAHSASSILTWSFLR